MMVMVVVELLLLLIVVAANNDKDDDDDEKQVLSIRYIRLKTNWTRDPNHVTSWQRKVLTIGQEEKNDSKIEENINSKVTALSTRNENLKSKKKRSGQLWPLSISPVRRSSQCLYKNERTNE